MVLQIGLIALILFARWKFDHHLTKYMNNQSVNESAVNTTLSDEPNK